ncbi:MAG: DUF5715 family protein [Longimicrobiales bacterium]
MIRSAAAAGLMVLAGATVASAQSLRGSRAAMIRQNSIAQEEDLSFLRTAADVRRFVESGLLVPLRGSANYEVEDVSFPYARTAVKLFIERLSAQYRSACGEKLVVTSLTRPLSRQPRNSHELSVHPTGMAADLRVSRRSSCRRWLESTLKALEGERVLDATRERRPSHYHVAIFPEKYNRHVARLAGVTEADVVASTRSSGMKIATVDAGTNRASVLPLPVSAPRVSTETSYTVRRGDSLWLIARRFGTSVSAIKEANQLARSMLQPGQKLTIPVSASAVADEVISH